MENEKAELENTKTKRSFAFYDTYDDFLKEMISSDKKQIRRRKWLYMRLKKAANTLFETGEAEYQFIGKFRRGMFAGAHEFLTKKEMETMVKIGMEYGAFNY